MTSAKSRTRFIGPLPWRRRLRVKLALVFLTTFVVLGLLAVGVNRLVVQSRLLDEVDRYARSDSLRIISGLSEIVSTTEQLSAALAALAESRRLSDLGAEIPVLLERSAVQAEIHGAGIWPEPYQTGANRSRASLVWMRDEAGVLQQREEYNDEEAVPYYREHWYTPARYATSGQCFWTSVYREALDQTLVVSCASPIRRNGEFIGVATVQLSRQALRDRFTRIATDGNGYALLADRNNLMLAWTDNAGQAFIDPVQPPRNLAELAQNEGAYRSLALDLHEDREVFLASAINSASYDARVVSELQDGTRNWARAEAESALASIWTRSPGNFVADRTGAQATVDNDPVLKQTARVSRSPVPGSHWRLIRVLPTQADFASAGELISQSLIITLAILALTLIAVYIGLGTLVLVPLQRMVGALAGTENAEDAVHVVLDERANNELGVLAHWYNERLRQLAEQMERSATSNSLLVMEVDERRKSQRSYEGERKRLETALKMVDQAVIATDLKGKVQEMNTAAEQLTGCDLASAKGKPLPEVFSAVLGDDRMPVPNVAQVCIQRGAQLDYSHGLKLETADGELRDLNLTVAPVPGDRGQPAGALLVFRSKRSTDRASGSAAPARESRQSDSTTGLANALACDQRLAEMLETSRLSGQTHALILLDLDRLKAFNDTAGYGAGDELLRFVAKLLGSGVKAPRRVFRLGADQFAISVDDASVEQAAELAESLRTSLAEHPFEWETKDHKITASFGVTEIGGDEDSAALALRRAEDACRRAKQDGRNLVRVFAPDMARRVEPQDDKLWVKRIRNGIDNNLFHLTTQWVSTTQELAKHGEVYEVLLALEDEEGFWAAPGSFMAAANRNHLAAEIDFWVIRSAVQYLSRHNQTVDRLAYCCINISGQSLTHPSLLDFIVETLQSNPLPPSKLCFEVNEDAITEHPAEAQAFFESLKSVGSRLSIDRFIGRNMSDLELMRRLPVDLVKLDAQQFRQLPGDPLEMAVAESVMRVAHTLRKEVVVANIDDPALLEAWKRLGADYLQGYVVAKPTPMIFTASRD